MKILVIGTGVIGTTYGWQLQAQGHDVSHFVRNPADRLRMADQGIRISCMDLRPGMRTESVHTYRPALTDSLDQIRDSLVIVPVNSNQLPALLTRLACMDPTCDFLIMQNMRPGDDELISEYLPPDRCTIGYPFKTGGGRDDSGINTVIFGNRMTHTMLGRTDGRITTRLKEIHAMLDDANMAPLLTKRIVAYVRTHYMWAAASVAAYLKAGSYERFISPESITETYRSMREGFKICAAQGINPLSVSPTRYYYLPLPILVPFTRKMYDDEGMKMMFEGHVRHSPDEMKDMVETMLTMGRRYGIDMPVTMSMKPFVDRYFDSIRSHA